MIRNRDVSKLECPTCGDTFSSERGMKVHHKRVHNQSIAGRDVECDTCGDVFSKRRCLVQQHTQHFCCASCRLECKRNDKDALLDELRRLEKKLDRTPSQSHLKEYTKYNKKSYKRAFGGWNEALRQAGMEPNRENYTKEDCLDDIRAVAEEIGHPPQIKEHNRHGEISDICIRQKFGSWVSAINTAGLAGSEVREYNIAQDDFITEIRAVAEEIGETPTKKDMTQHGAYAGSTVQKVFDSWSDALRRAGFEPNRKPMVTIKCTYCDESTEKLQQHANRAENSFCTQECHWEWLREGNAPSGSEHHQYVPNTSRPNYGEGWYGQRRKARKRDAYTCQRCGMEDPEHKDAFGCELHVHHITPWHEFDDPHSRNKLTNLITLCARCHMKIEQLPVTPQFEIS